MVLALEKFCFTERALAVGSGVSRTPGVIKEVVVLVAIARADPVTAA
jgi:hypothetical protein